MAARVDEVVRSVTAAALELLAANAGWFAPTPPQLTLVSPLADGADQLAAAAALAHGYRLQAVLPFSKELSRAEVAPGHQGDFDAFADKASCLLELPGDPTRPIDAYVMAGRATVAHSDLLIAVWDGDVPRGRGGTGEIVELAMARGTPIIHIPTDSGRPITLMWSAYDPAVLTMHSDDIDRR
ncbi:MAG TPA: hypothetical protein VNA29_09760, partial [Sphingomicrobium sp.]|nr:hypothetical protein [Sphingomicrobium sp.]